MKGCLSARQSKTKEADPKSIYSRFLRQYKQRCGADADAGGGAGWVGQPEVRGGDKRRLCAVPHVSGSSRGPRAAQGRGQGHPVFGKPEQTRKRSAEKGGGNRELGKILATMPVSCGLLPTRGSSPSRVSKGAKLTSAYSHREISPTPTNPLHDEGGE